MKPYFRMFCTPVTLNADLVDVEDKDLHRLLSSPPETRYGGWTLWPAQDLRPTLEGLEAIGYGGRRLFLLKNGHLEFWVPCTDEQFKWRQSDSEQRLHQWLHPYAVCELPVNFMRLARHVYDRVQLTAEVVVGLAFYSVRGFVLRPGVPGSDAFLRSVFEPVRPYDREDMKIRPVTGTHDFDPDELALRVVRQVYQGFSCSSDYIPCFDRDGRFVLK